MAFLVLGGVHCFGAADEPMGTQSILETEMHLKNIAEEVRFDPARMTKVNLFETARFFCDLYCLRPGQSQRIHSHDGNDKVYQVVRGEAQVTVGGEKRPARPGDVVLAPSGEPHGIANESTEDVVCIVFMAPHPEPGRFS